MKNNLKKCLALLLSVVMVLAMAVAVFADPANNNGANSNNAGKTTVAITEDNKSKTTGTLTVSGATENATYTAYKLFSATVGNGDTYTWTVESAWSSAVGSETPETIAAKDASGLKAFAATLATEANLTEKTGTTITTSSTSIGLGYYLVVESNTNGLEKSQPILVAIPQVQNNAWAYDIAITPKSSSTNFEKKIAENGSLVDINTKNIGDYVDYRLVADIPTYEDSAYTDAARTVTFKITDNMSKELTWGSKSAISVYVVDTTTDEGTIAGLTNLAPLSADNNYTVTPPDENVKGGTFTVDFTKSFLSTNKGKKVVVAFSAILNEDAVIGSATSANNVIDNYSESGDNKVKDAYYNGKGNPNGATLEFSNSYYAGGETDKIKDIVTTFTFDLKAEKVDADNETLKLGGAEFTVYTDASCTEDKKYSNTSTGFANPLITANATDSNTGAVLGQVTAVGFDEGTYYLKETKAPKGYQQYDGVIKVQIIAGKNNDSGEYNGTFTYTIDLGSYNTNASVWEEAADNTQLKNETIVTVKDKKGLTLPGTGGIGTTLFTFGGLALVILAAVLFIVYTKKQKKQS